MYDDDDYEDRDDEFLEAEERHDELLEAVRGGTDDSLESDDLGGEFDPLDDDDDAGPHSIDELRSLVNPDHEPPERDDDYDWDERANELYGPGPDVDALEDVEPPSDDDFDREAHEWMGDPIEESDGPDHDLTNEVAEAHLDRLDDEEDNDAERQFDSDLPDDDTESPLGAL